MFGGNAFIRPPQSKMAISTARRYTTPLPTFVSRASMLAYSQLCDLPYKYNLGAYTDYEIEHRQFAVQCAIIINNLIEST